MMEGSINKLWPLTNNIRNKGYLRTKLRDVREADDNEIADGHRMKGYYIDICTGIK